MKTASILFVVLMLQMLAQGSDSEVNLSQSQRFYQLTMTRGWELGIWRIKNDKSDDKSAKLFELSMTAQAFRYWILVHEGLIERSFVHEAQIRRSFSNGDLKITTLKNPLHRDSRNQGGFGTGIFLDAEKYEKLAREFERFVSEK